MGRFIFLKLTFRGHYLTMTIIDILCKRYLLHMVALQPLIMFHPIVLKTIDTNTLLHYIISISSNLMMVLPSSKLLIAVNPSLIFSLFSRNTRITASAVNSSIHTNVFLLATLT